MTDRPHRGSDGDCDRSPRPPGDRLSFPDLDREAAVRATLVSLVVLVAGLAAGPVVTAAVTAGSQPMPAVERVPVAPAATAWADAPGRTVSLEAQRMALPHGGGSVGEMRVRALTNGSHVAFRLTWADPTADASLAAPRAYSDAVAIMLHGGETPPITMGATGTPVNIWYWRASWEYGTKTSEWSGDMYTYPHPDNVTRPGLAAGNPLSKRSYETYAGNYYAKGYGSLSVAPEQNVRAQSRRTDGRWQVTFVRERSTAGTYDAAFDEHERMYLTVAVWNGSADEANGQKSLAYTFTRLDTKSGELAAGTPASGGDGGATAADGGTGEDDGTPGRPLDRAFSAVDSAVTVLVTVVLVAWLLAYRRTND